jgi:hypothetical protein
MKKFLLFVFIVGIAGAAIIFYGDRIGIDVSKFGIDKSELSLNLNLGDIQITKDNCPN